MCFRLFSWKARQLLRSRNLSSKANPCPRLPHPRTLHILHRPRISHPHPSVEAPRPPPLPLPTKMTRHCTFNQMKTLASNLLLHPHLSPPSISPTMWRKKVQMRPIHHQMTLMRTPIPRRNTKFYLTCLETRISAFRRQSITKRGS